MFPAVSDTHPVIHIMPEQIGVEDIGGTLRLGSYPCVLDEHSRAYQLYGTTEIKERHRHRYEVNNDYREKLAANGMKLSGDSLRRLSSTGKNIKTTPSLIVSREQSGQAHFSSPNPSLMRGLDTLCAEHNCEAIFYLLCECAYYFYLIGKILSRISVTRSFL